MRARFGRSVWWPRRSSSWPPARSWRAAHTARQRGRRSSSRGERGLTSLARASPRSPAAGSSYDEVADRCRTWHSQAKCPPERCEPSHVYPTTSGRRRLLVALSCRPWRRVRDAEESLSWGHYWWQVQGSNLGRLSRRFTDCSPLCLDLVLLPARRCLRGTFGRGGRALRSPAEFAQVISVLRLLPVWRSRLHLWGWAISPCDALTTRPPGAPRPNTGRSGRPGRPIGWSTKRDPDLAGGLTLRTFPRVRRQASS